MRVRFASLLVLGILAVAASTGHAFNGRRSGFVLGFGVGPSVTSFTQKLTIAGLGSATGDRENEFGLATGFKIGAGIGERFLLYYVNNVSWFSLENILGGDVTIANSVGLVGVSYYLEDESPSPYILGLVGLSSWDAPFEGGTDAQVGFGIGGGVGWEFSPHWSIEATLNWGKPSDEEFGFEAETNALAFFVTINALAY